MFFNVDILYQTGPLALVWMAGSDKLFLTGKRKNSKIYHELLKANMPALIRRIIKQIPPSGTSNGITFRKMCLLMKGISVIYTVQLEDWSGRVLELRKLLYTSVVLETIDVVPNDMYLAPDFNDIIALRTITDPSFGRIRNFDMDQEISEMTFNTADARWRPFDWNETFVSSSENQEPGLNEPVISTRRRQIVQEGQKLEEENDSFQVDERSVMRMLATEIEFRPQTHQTLNDLEDVPLIPNVEQNFDDYQTIQNLPSDMNSSLLELFGGYSRLPFNEDANPEAIRAEDEQSPIEGQKIKDVHIDLSPVTRNESRECENVQNIAMDIQLQPIQSEDQLPSPPKKQKILPKYAVKMIPNEIAYASALATMEAIPFENLQAKALVHQIRPKKIILQNMKGMQFIGNSGRTYHSFKLKGMIQNIVKALPLVAKDQNEPIEKLRLNSTTLTRNRLDLTGNIARGSTGNVTRDATSFQGISIADSQHHMSAVEQSSIDVSAMIGPIPEDFGNLSYQDGAYVPDVLPRIDPSPPNYVDDIPQLPVVEGVTMIDDCLSQAIQKGIKMFAELMPVRKCSRKQAARGFATFLKLQQDRKVSLYQKECYGPIQIRMIVNED